MGGSGFGSGQGDLESLVDVTERLMAEFEDRLGLPEVAQVVIGCRSDLRGSPATALPELVERLARQRLDARLSERAAVPAG